MVTVLMFGKYSAQSLKGVSAKRTKQVEAMIKKCGGEIKAMYVLLGEKDLLFIASFPGIDEAIQTSIALSKSTGIGFTTCPAVTVEEFDRLMSG